MPVYDYKCPEHGIFYDLATVEQGGEPAACPHCGTSSPRIIMIAPEFLGKDSKKKKAIEHNEEAQFSPILSTQDSRAEAKERAEFEHKRSQLRSSCGCSHEHNHNQSPLKQQVILLPDGSKVFPSQRPWMISH